MAPLRSKSARARSSAPCAPAASPAARRTVGERAARVAVIDQRVRASTRARPPPRRALRAAAKLTASARAARPSQLARTPIAASGPGSRAARSTSTSCSGGVVLAEHADARERAAPPTARPTRPHPPRAQPSYAARRCATAAAASPPTSSTIPANCSVSSSSCSRPSSVSVRRALRSIRRAASDRPRNASSTAWQRSDVASTAGDPVVMRSSRTMSRHRPPARDTGFGPQSAACGAKPSVAVMRRRSFAARAAVSASSSTASHSANRPTLRERRREDGVRLRRARLVPERERARPRPPRRRASVSSDRSGAVRFASCAEKHVAHARSAASSRALRTRRARAAPCATSPIDSSASQRISSSSARARSSGRATASSARPDNAAAAGRSSRSSARCAAAPQQRCRAPRRAARPDARAAACTRAPARGGSRRARRARRGRPPSCARATRPRARARSARDSFSSRRYAASRIRTWWNRYTGSSIQYVPTGSTSSLRRRLSRTPSTRSLTRVRREVDERTAVELLADDGRELDDRPFVAAQTIDARRQQRADRRRHLDRVDVDGDGPPVRRPHEDVVVHEHAHQLPDEQRVALRRRRDLREQLGRERVRLEQVQRELRRRALVEPFERDDRGGASAFRRATDADRAAPDVPSRRAAPAHRGSTRRGARSRSRSNGSAQWMSSRTRTTGCSRRRRLDEPADRPERLLGRSRRARHRGSPPRASRCGRGPRRPPGCATRKLLDDLLLGVRLRDPDRGCASDRRSARTSTRRPDRIASRARARRRPARPSARAPDASSRAPASR